MPLNSRDPEERAEHSTGADLTASEFRAMVPNQGDYGAEGRSAMSATFWVVPSRGDQCPRHTLEELRSALRLSFPLEGRAVFWPPPGGGQKHPPWSP